MKNIIEIQKIFILSKIVKNCAYLEARMEWAKLPIPLNCFIKDSYIIS